jgi:hypothetical protein
MMEAASTSETSVYFYETIQHNIPECCHIHVHTDCLNGKRVKGAFSLCVCRGITVYTLNEFRLNYRRFLSGNRMQLKEITS